MESEANVEVLTPEAEPVTTEPEKDWKEEYNKLDQNYKAAQRNLSNIETKLRQKETQGADVSVLKQELDSIKENQAKTLDYINFVVENLEGQANPYEEVPKKAQPKTLNYDAYKQAKAEEESRRQQDESRARDENDAMEALAEAGLSASDPDVQALASSNTARDFIKKLPALVKKKVSEKETEEARLQAENARKQAKADAENTGAFDNPGIGGRGGTGGQIPTDRAKFQKYVEDLSMEEYKKQKPQLDAMLASGKLK